MSSSQFDEKMKSILESNNSEDSGETIPLTIRITAIVAREQLDREDRELPPEVTLHVKSSVPERKRADVALDIFIQSNAVKFPEDFEFEVLQDGKVLDTDPDHDSSQFSIRWVVK